MLLPRASGRTDIICLVEAIVSSVLVQTSRILLAQAEHTLYVSVLDFSSQVPVPS